MNEGFYYATNPINGERTPIVVERAVSLEGGKVGLAAFDFESTVGHDADFYSNYQLMKQEEIQAELSKRRAGLRNLSAVSGEEGDYNRKRLGEEISLLERRMNKYHIPIHSEQVAMTPKFNNNPFETLSI